MTRVNQWEWAAKEFTRRAGNARYLFGTFMDRQEARLVTHRYRRQMGVEHLPPMDHARLRTKAVDGTSRMNLYGKPRGVILDLFEGVALQVREGAYEPGILTGARWPKDDLTPQEIDAIIKAEGCSAIRWRVIFYPSEVDKVVAAVLLEVIEPIIDPILSPFQHGYRATRIEGRKITIPGFKHPRGSTEIVVERLVRGINAGKILIAYLDVINAFDSVDRDILHGMLVADGCPSSFAHQIIRILGSRGYAPWLDPEGTSRETGNVDLQGIPLGSPVGPLAFNYFIRSIHLDPTREAVMVGYADDLWLVGRVQGDLDRAMADVIHRLEGIGLKARVDIWNLQDGEPRGILGHEIRLPERSRKAKVDWKTNGALVSRGSSTSLVVG